MDRQEKIYQIALSKVKGVGCTWFKKLINHFGTAEAVYNSKQKELCFFGKALANEISKKDTLQIAESILIAHEKANIKVLSLWEQGYPTRLQQIPDAPPLLYFRGSGKLSSEKIVSIVGTRKATTYGKGVVTSLVEELSYYNPIIVSGLAYGIDIHVHKVALKHNLSTLAVVASGLDIIYPASHYSIAMDMCVQGGIISEYPLKTALEPHQFPTRNRIIAGLSDATIVVEANKKSGALITAHFANDYHREVFAVPGNLDTPGSIGCNHFIKTHQAYLLTSAADIAYVMNWEGGTIKKKIPSKVQLATIMTTLTNIEKKIVQILLPLEEGVHIDVISHKTQLPLSQLSAILLQLELQGIVCCLPGKQFKISFVI